MQLPFLKKKDVEKVSSTDRVRELSSKGFSEIEMIDILRKDGYSPEEIDKALTQSLRMGVSAPAFTPPATSYAPPAPQTSSRLPTLDEIAPATEMPEIPEVSLPPQYSQPTMSEEYVNYLVEDRVGDLKDRLNDVSYKTRELEQRIEDIQERVGELLQARSAEQTQILNKIDEFKDVVLGTDARVGSLEKAFKETLPALIESVRALSDVVQRLKREA